MPERLVRSAVFLERFLPRAAASLCHMPCFIFKRRGKIMRERFVGVETYSGFKADERPLRLHLNDRTLQVVAVEDRWYSPGETFFRVVVAGGDRYVLRQDRKSTRLNSRSAM